MKENPGTTFATDRGTSDAMLRRITHELLPEVALLQGVNQSIRKLPAIRFLETGEHEFVVRLDRIVNRVAYMVDDLVELARRSAQAEGVERVQSVDVDTVASFVADEAGLVGGKPVEVIPSRLVARLPRFILTDVMRQLIAIGRNEGHKAHLQLRTNNESGNGLVIELAAKDGSIWGKAAKQEASEVGALVESSGVKADLATEGNVVRCLIHVPVEQQQRGDHGRRYTLIFSADADVVRIMREGIRPHEHTLSAHDDALAFLIALQENSESVDLVVVDLTSTEATGLERVLQVLKASAFKSISVVLVSAKPGKSSLAENGRFATVAKSSLAARLRELRGD